jgi:hypothetical protein
MLLCSNQETRLAQVNRGEVASCSSASLCPLSLPLRRAFSPTGQYVAGWVARPDLEGGQVAVLRLHAAVSWLRNYCTIPAVRGERITQLQYLYNFLCEVLGTPSMRSSTSEKAQKAKFAEFFLCDVGNSCVGVHNRN